MKKIIMIISILLLLSGCYDHKELNDLAVISAININKNNNNYALTLQIINPQKKESESQNKSEFIIYKSTGNNINIAFNNIINKISKKLYEPQIQLLLLDENICKNNLKEVLDYFIRNNESRNEFYVLISKNKNNILENYFSKDIIDTLKTNNNYTGTASLTTLNDLIDTYQNKDKEIVLPILENNQNEISIKYSGIFKNNRLIDYLSQEETITYNLMMNNINNTLITINNNNKYIINELIKPKSNIKLSLKKNKIIINIKATAITRENNYNNNLNRKDNINIIEKKLNNKIKKQIKNFIYKTNKKYKTDIYGFKDLIHKNNLNYYKKNIKNNTNYLNNINIEVKSKITIVNDENLLGGINNE